jgi:hypothetical protein
MEGRLNPNQTGQGFGNAPVPKMGSSISPKMLIGVAVVLALVVLAALKGKREHLDNPLVFLLAIILFVDAGNKGFQVLFTRLGWTGAAAFFGAHA